MLPAFPQEPRADITELAERTDIFTGTRSTEAEPVNYVINTFVPIGLCYGRHL